jgi:hypothetical protein
MMHPEIVHCSLNTDRILSQRGAMSKNVSFDDSTIKNKTRLIHSQQFQKRAAQAAFSNRDNSAMVTIEEGSGTIDLDDHRSPPTFQQLTGCDFNTVEFLFCKLIGCLIANDEALLRAKGDFLNVKCDVEKRLNLASRFSPVSMFQRIDRPGKGYITRQEMLQFLEENGYRAGEGFEGKDIGLIMKSKIDYQA